MSNRNQKVNMFKKALFLGSVAGLAVASPALAQDVNPSLQDEKNAYIDTIIVTATKTGASDLQHVPLAISAYSAETLDATGAVSLSDIVAYTPGYTYTSNSVWSISSIRGVGTNNVFAGGDPSATLQVDGVYYGRPTGANLDFLDVERVEVLRGPQGTLYGRNAVAGTTNVITREPSDDFMGTVKLSVGEYGLMRPEFAVSGPLVDEKVSFSLAGRYSKRDGYIKQLVAGGEDLWDENRKSIRGKLKFAPNETMSLVLAADYSDADEGYNFATVRITPSANDGFNPGFFEAATDDPNQYELTQWGTSATWKWDISDQLELTSITAYRDSDSILNGDLDFTALPLFTTRAFVEEQNQFTQEVNLSGRFNKAEFIAGLFYYHENADSYFNATITDSLLLSQGIDVETDSYAAFAQVKYQLSDRLSVTGGVRYTEDEKSTSNDYGISFALDPTLTDGGLGADPLIEAPGSEIFTDTAKFDAFTPKLGLEFQANDSVLGYASITKGFKSGGYNLLIDPASASRARYNPEEVWAYEGGIKSRVNVPFPGTINLAGFYYDYEGLQVNQFVFLGASVAQLVSNAPAAKISGLEIETNLHPNEHISFGGHLAYLNATYNGSFTAEDSLNGGQIDADGRILSDAPKWSGGIFGELRDDFGDYEASVRADVSFKGDVFYSPLNAPELGADAYTFANLSMNLKHTDSGLSFGVRANNITNKKYITGNYFAFSSGGIPGAPRHITAYIKKDF